MPRLSLTLNAALVAGSLLCFAWQGLKATAKDPLANAGGASFAEDEDSPSPPAYEAEWAANNRANADPLTPELADLRDDIREALDYYRRPLNSRDHTPWEIMHDIVAYGVQSEIRRGGPKGESVNAIAWLACGAPCKNEKLLVLEGDRLVARKGPRVQGHPGQLLAILAQSRVQRDYPFEVAGRDFTMQDLIASEKLGSKTGMELTFKLIGLMYYLESDATWKNEAGEGWSIRRLIREEIAAPVNGAACGGTHRLMGLSYAFRERLRRGEPLDGEFLDARKHVEKYRRQAFGAQNRDGSLSTEWFKGKGARNDLGRRLQTTGHILEWLAYAADEKDLRDPKLVKCVRYLTGILLKNKQRKWEIGPLGHALHSLAIYDRRVFKPHDEPATAQSDSASDYEETPAGAMDETATSAAERGDPVPFAIEPIPDDPAAAEPDFSTTAAVDAAVPDSVAEEPVDPEPVDSTALAGSIETASIETASIETASVETASVETASVETASVETASVETASVPAAAAAQEANDEDLALRLVNPLRGLRPEASAAKGAATDVAATAPASDTTSAKASPAEQNAQAQARGRPPAAPSVMRAQRAPRDR